jgi:putative phosphoribosyl transferase
MQDIFVDRVDAGRRLAIEVRALGLVSPVILALPRGGVTVAAEIARALGAPLDLVLAGKIGARGQPEYAIAAVAEGPEPALVIDPELAHDEALVADIHARLPQTLAELERRRRAYLHGRDPVPVAGRPVVLVDDGIATGATARAALRSLRARGPSRIVLAVPCAPASECAALAREVDDFVCPLRPAWFGAVSAFYRDFSQVSDAEVLAALGSLAAAGPH